MCNSAGMSMKNNDLQQAFRLSLPVLGAFPWRTPCQTVTIIYDRHSDDKIMKKEKITKTRARGILPEPSLDAYHVTGAGKQPSPILADGTHAAY